MAKKNGGLKKIEKINKKKSQLLYKEIDSSDLYINNINKNNRSDMNVCFKLINKKLNKIFLKESYKEGLFELQGHKSHGGIRASIYNAMPIEGVKKLALFMKKFSKKYR